MNVQNMWMDGKKGMTRCSDSFEHGISPIAYDEINTTLITDT